MSKASRTAEMATFTSTWQYFQFTSRRMGAYVFLVGAVVGGLSGGGVGRAYGGVALAWALAAVWAGAFLVSARVVWKTGSWLWGLLCCVPMIAICISVPLLTFGYGLYFLFLGIQCVLMLIMRAKLDDRAVNPDGSKVEPARGPRSRYGIADPAPKRRRRGKESTT